VLDFVPLAGAGRQVADHDVDAELVGQLLQFAFPQPQQQRGDLSYRAWPCRSRHCGDAVLLPLVHPLKPTVVSRQTFPHLAVN